MVNFHFLAGITLRDRNRLKAFIGKLMRHEGRLPGEISIVFCSDEHLLEMNRLHLKHDFYTDILTFDLSLDPHIISGELYISVDRVKENAKDQRTSLTIELHRVIFHGILHLCGFNDKSVKQASAMRSKEDEYLKKYF